MAKTKMTTAEKLEWLFTQACNESNTFAARLDALKQADAMKARAKKSWYALGVTSYFVGEIGATVGTQFADAISNGHADIEGLTTYKDYQAAMANDRAIETEAREIELDESLIERIDLGQDTGPNVDALTPLLDRLNLKREAGDEEDPEAANDEGPEPAGINAEAYRETVDRVQMNAAKRAKWESEANNLPPIGQTKSSKTPWWRKVWLKLTASRDLARLVKAQNEKHGDAGEAIAFALTISDHYDLREFLKAWNTGDWLSLQEEWAEYYDWLFEERHC